MKRSTYLMIDVVCIYSSLLGALNYSLDRRSACARIKTHITIYSAVMTLIMLAAIIYFTVTIEFKTQPPGRDEVYYKFNVFLMTTRATAVVTTLLYNWINLPDYVKFINAYRSFSVKFIRKWRVHETYENLLEQGIRLRCQYTFLADICIYIGTALDLHDIFDIDNDLILLFLALIPTTLTVYTSFYYFTALNANVLMIIINEELKRILATAFILHQNHSKATLARHGQKLAKEMDELAEAQNKLKAFVKRINKMFDPQETWLMLDLYASNICVIYMLWLFVIQPGLWNGHEDRTSYLVPVFFLVYYLDLKVFLFEVLKTEDLMKKTAEILKERVYLGQQMEKSLEKSLTDYSFQLATNPLEVDVMGLYKMDRAMTFASFSSTITHVIVVIQYDFKYSN